MSDLPSWLAAAQPRLEPPAWLVRATAPEPTLSEATKASNHARYELVFPRVLEYMYAGQTLASALRDLPGHYGGGGINKGSFIRWVNADATRKMLYKEAKEIRTEALADQMMRHARGELEDGTPSPNDVARDKLIVDVLWRLMGAQNRKEYGDTKTIDVTGNISIVGALEASRSRVQQVVDIGPLDDGVPLLLDEAVEVMDEDDDDE